MNTAESGQPGNQAGAERRLLQQCRECAETQLRACIKQVLDQTDDLLFQRSNANTPDAGDYFNVLRDLRLRRQALEHRYFADFAQEYAARLGTAPAPRGGRTDPVAAGALSLVDETELEESLAIDGMIGKAKERYHSQLYALTRRYRALVPGSEIEEESHPLGPDVVCHAFRKAFEDVEVGVAIKLLVYKLFEQHTLKRLGTLYEEVDGLLVNAGVLPQLKAAVAVRADGERPAGAVSAAVSDSAGRDGGDAAGPATGEPAGDVYQTLQRLMSLRKYGAAPQAGAAGLPPDHGAGAGGAGDFMPGYPAGGAAGGYGAAPPLPAADLVQGLSLLQQLPPPAAAAAGESGVAYIKNTLLQQLGESAAGRVIDPVHDNTIDVIGMIFEFILDEPSIPDLVKRLLNQLQIPILKVAIVDKEFFTHKQHPARRLLNTLGHASIGWGDKDAATQQRRYERMEYIVERVLKEYQTDPGIFAELLQGFTDFLASEDDEAVQLDDKPAEAAAEAAPASPEQQTFEVIASRLEGSELPRGVRDFLREGWHKVMMQAAAEQGVDGELWRRRQQTLDDLLWSLTPKKTTDDRRRMAALLPRLLAALQDGMRAAASAQHEIDAVLDGLQSMHMACLRGEPPSAAPDTRAVTAMIRSVQQGLGPVPEDAPALAADDMTDAGPGPAVIDDTFHETALALAPGAWLEFELGDKRRRAKLGWKSAVLDQYIFVDRRYKVVAEKTLTELAADLRAGRARRVEHVGMFDRALDRVLNGLMAGSRGH